jgi:hypothetical protein
MTAAAAAAATAPLACQHEPRPHCSRSPECTMISSC